MSTQTAPQPVRTYGGWRRARGFGMWGLGLAGTLTVLALIGVALITVAVDLTALLYVGPVVVVVLAFLLVRIGGVSLAHLIHGRVAWWNARRHGWTSYKSGVVVDHPRAWQLPGVLSGTELVTAEAGIREPYGIVWDRHSGLLTATLNVAPTSTWLADPAEIDSWVASWGHWLAGLGYQPMVRWISVTTSTAPDPGSTLADEVLGSLDPRAPEGALRIMRELVETSPAIAAAVDTRVSITFDPARSAAKGEGMAQAVAEVGRALSGLEAALSECGAAVRGRATAAELAGILRVAFDPASRGEVARVLAAAAAGDPAPPALSWGEAGPVAAEESWDHYVHDSGVSVSWAWHEAPRSQVTAQVLGRLLSPGEFAKRVTLLYRPAGAQEAADTLQSEVNAAAFRAAYREKTGRDPSARDRADQERAERSAAEEAEGAGLGLLGVYVTTTVQDKADLPRAVADTEARADQSKIRLRRLRGSQAAGFATTLPAGVCPPVMATRWPR